MRRRSLMKQVFVSYKYYEENSEGFGNTTQFFTNNRKHVSHKDIRYMEKTIKEENNFTNVVILNYRIM